MEEVEHVFECDERDKDARDGNKKKRIKWDLFRWNGHLLSKVKERTHPAWVPRIHKIKEYATSP